MSAEETLKSKQSEAADIMESDMEDRDKARSDDDRSERQDLTQGMDTGTHDSTRGGVNWGRSYRNLGKAKNDTPNEVAPKEDAKKD
jgi:hypothetical protein